MLLYDSKFAPNPRRVRMFLAEKGVSVPTQAVDLGKLEQKQDSFRAINPIQRIPALQLDDGTVISESIAICRYFEEMHPQPPLFGRNALEKALVEMWQRRLEMHFLLPIAMVFRHTHPAMREMENPQIPLVAETNAPRVAEFLEYFDSHLQNSRFSAGDEFSVADITGIVAFDFMRPARLTAPAHLTNLQRWREEVAARPSASA
ncbi:MAG: glutathione S-transferase [Hyphomicrobiales bacterium]|nr:glutathione S-transferase [Hyphomicrobiales bacterium]